MSTVSCCLRSSTVLAFGLVGITLLGEIKGGGKGPRSICFVIYIRVMLRRPRVHLDGIPLHIVQRGHNREPCFFGEEEDRLFSR